MTWKIIRKITSIVILITFLSTNVIYAAPGPRKTLRVPLGFAREKLLEQEQTGLPTKEMLLMMAQAVAMRMDDESILMDLGTTFFNTAFRRNLGSPIEIRRNKNTGTVHIRYNDRYISITRSGNISVSSRINFDKAELVIASIKPLVASSSDPTDKKDRTIGSLLGLMETLADLGFKPGEKIAFVGKIGSGKTSILRMLAGLYDSTEGSIKIDNSDVKHMHPDDLRKHVGVVMQQPVIFSGTLKENLLLGNPDATDEQIIKASKIANVDKIAADLPNGYDTVFSEGGQELSGGQKQAICIARAFINDPKIIIMDEPSSAMDQASEQELLRDLKEAVKDKTFLLITHRGTLLDAVDRIVAIQDGRVVKDDSKEAFMKPAPQPQPAPKPAPEKK